MDEGYGKPRGNHHGKPDGPQVVPLCLVMPPLGAFAVGHRVYVGEEIRGIVDDLAHIDIVFGDDEGQDVILHCLHLPEADRRVAPEAL
ncbi:hypothetical protein DSECCO2_626530 [anaerobic digester metagenome]